MLKEASSNIIWRRFLRLNRQVGQELNQFPSLAPHLQRRALAERLLAQIQYFGNREDALPEWREAARVRDPEELWSHWPSLPIVDKGMLQSRFHPREIQAKFHLKGVAGSTGGSTGEPTPYFHDERALRVMSAVTAFARLRMGWRPGMAIIVVWGSERDIGKSGTWRGKLSNLLRNRLLIDGYDLTEQTVRRVVATIRRHRPVAIYGFTSMLEFVATKALEMNITPSPGSVKAAWNGGEMLLAHQSEIFCEAFGVPILNWYGGRELSTMAVQDREGSPLHVVRPFLFVEVVDDEGKPVGPNEPGRLLWTSTVCQGTPFLRYDVGDVGVYDRAHKNESGIFGLRELQGRVAGLLSLPTGKKISCLYWNHLFKEVPEVHQFQVILKKDGRLALLLKGEGFTSAREAQLRTTVANFLGAVPLDISWVDKIPLTPQGKLVQAIREQ